MDSFFRALLFTTQEPFIVPVLIIGYLAFRREAFTRTTLVLLLSLSINPFLKSLFEVPLPESLGKEGWALPSGHMQSAVVFWGWLAIEAKNRVFFALLPLLWLGIGAGLVHFDYHSPADVAAAVVSGSLLLGGYYLLIKNTCLSRRSLGIIITGLSALFYLLTPHCQEHSYLLVAPSALTGFTLGWLLLPEDHCGMPQTWIQKSGLILLVTAGIAALYVGTQYIPNLNLRALALYGGLGFWAGSLGPWALNRILRQKN